MTFARAITRLPIQHYAFMTSGIVLLAFAAAYMYFLSFSVIHVVINQENEEKMHRVNAEIAALEAKYMERQIAIGNEIVNESGYVKAVEKIFVNKGQSSVVTKR